MTTLATHRLHTAESVITPFDGEGGLGKMFQLFGDRMEPLIAELNEALVA